MKCNKLNHIEEVLVNHLRGLFPDFVELLFEQIASSQIAREKYSSHWFTFFSPSSQIQGDEWRSSYLIQVVLGDITYVGGYEIRKGSKLYVINPYELGSNSSNDIAFIIHIKEGFLREFELYNISGDTLTFEHLLCSPCVVYAPHSKIRNAIDNP